MAQNVIDNKRFQEMARFYMQLGMPQDMIPQLVWPGMNESDANTLVKSVAKQNANGVPPYNMNIDANLSPATTQAQKKVIAANAQAKSQAQQGQHVARVRQANAQAQNQVAQGPTINAANSLAMQQSQGAPVQIGGGSGVNGTSMVNGGVVTAGGNTMSNQNSYVPTPGIPSVGPSTQSIPNMAPGQANYGLPGGALQGQSIDVTGGTPQSVGTVPVPSPMAATKYTPPTTSAVGGITAPSLAQDTYAQYNQKMSDMGLTGNMSEYQGSMADGTYDSTMTGLANYQSPSTNSGGSALDVINSANAKTGDGSGLDWGMKGIGGTALGAGQLILGGLSYFDNKKTQKKQRQLMDQQIAHNDYSLAKTKKHDKQWKETTF